MAALLFNTYEATLNRAVSAATAVFRVPEHHVAFLEVDNESQRELAPGVHVFWKYPHLLALTLFDRRLQNMEVNGQEILTKDRVSLRINLSATWQVRQPERVKAELADAKDFLYREMQLALRAIVSTQTLDELLADKNSLNLRILELVSAKTLAYGIEIKTVGARDIVLPGDMKAILAQVVEAQKMAEANLIKRQEETQATRSLHNTAKVMEGNPILLRLKELEALEKVAGRINTLNVYGGLNGVMNDLVRLVDRSTQRTVWGNKRLVDSERTFLKLNRGCGNSTQPDVSSARRSVQPLGRESNSPIRFRERHCDDREKGTGAFSSVTTNAPSFKSMA